MLSSEIVASFFKASLLLLKLVINDSNFTGFTFTIITFLAKLIIVKLNVFTFNFNRNILN